MADIKTLTVEELGQLRLGSLNSAVEDWKVMAGQLSELASGGGDGVSAWDLERKAKAADWEGVNATVSRAFVTKTAKQFGDAAAEAKDVAGILSDLAAQMAKHKEDLRTAVDGLSRQGILVQGDGKVRDTLPTGPGPWDADPDFVRPTSEQIAAGQQRITRILWEATETDRIARDALRAIMKDEHDFSGAGAGSLQEADARQGRAAAEKWKKDILAGDYRTWTDAELKAFNQALMLHRDNPAFTESLFAGLGAQETFTFWRELAHPYDGPAGDERAELLAKVQDNLSMSLANLSHQDTPAAEQFKHDLIAAGPRQLPGDLLNGPTGFQVMSSLMREGRFDKDFLNDYGTALITHERNRWHGSGEPWTSGIVLTYPQTDEEKNLNDPMTGFLEALGHNPQASLDFLNRETGTGSDEITNFQYLVGNADHARQWPAGADGYDELGHALESATLGYPYDSKDPAVPPMATPTQIEARDARTALVQQVVEAYADPELLEKLDGIAGSLARVAAGHMDSINYTMDNWGGLGDLADRDGFYGKDEAHLRDMGYGTAKAFLRNVAADEVAHQTLTSAQQVYGTSLMASHGGSRDEVMLAAERSVRMHGLIDEPRFEAIGAEFKEVKEQQDLKQEQKAAWVEYGVGAAVGAGAGLITAPAGGIGAVAVPIAVDTAGAGMETAAGNYLMGWLKENEYDNKYQAIRSIDTATEAGENNAVAPVRAYLEREGLSSEEVNDLISDCEDAYDRGRNRTDTDNVEK